MRYLNDWLRVVNGAIYGAVGGCLIYVIVAAILGLMIAGIGGMIGLPLYFGLYAILVCMPVGVVIGATLAGVPILWERRNQQPLAFVLALVAILFLIAYYLHVNREIFYNIMRSVR